MTFSVQILDRDTEGFLMTTDKTLKSYGMAPQKFSVVIELDGLTDAEANKVHQAVDHWMAAFNSPLCMPFVCGYSWKETVCSGRLWWKKCTEYTRTFFRMNNGLSNEQVYVTLMSGKEIVGDGKIDHTAQIYLKVDRKNKRSVIGYTYPNSKFQWIYQWALQSFTIEEIAGNLSHEYCHRVGFPDSSYAASRHSVSYTIGEWVENFKNT